MGLSVMTCVSLLSGGVLCRTVLKLSSVCRCWFPLFLDRLGGSVLRTLAVLVALLTLTRVLVRLSPSLFRLGLVVMCVCRLVMWLVGVRMGLGLVLIGVLVLLIRVVTSLWTMDLGRVFTKLLIGWLLWTRSMAGSEWTLKSLVSRTRLLAPIPIMLRWLVNLAVTPLSVGVSRWYGVYYGV